jgi:predicted nucleic acid-binding protein
LIDVARDRQPFAAPATELLSRIERSGRSAYIAWHTVSNFYYLVAPARGGAVARDFILDLTRFVSIASTDTNALRYAASLPFSDFEDAMQVAAAHACGARHIITRNLRDFRRSPIPAISPQEALDRLF